MDSPATDQLVLLSVSDLQARPLMKQLNKEDFRFTVINTSANVVQDGIVCLLVGFPHERLARFLEAVRKNCHSYRKFIPAQGMLPVEQAAFPMMESQAGGALIYLMNVHRFEQI